jgi:hypothetical protein
MPEDGIGSALWKNVQAVKFGKDGGIEVPVRANGRDGIEVGLDAMAEGENREAEEGRTDGAPAPRGWRRFFRR